MDKIDRKKELLSYIENDDIELLMPLVEMTVDLECRIAELEKLPMIRVNPNDPVQQKHTPAFKLYKECIQQYTNCIKVLKRSEKNNGSTNMSELSKWCRQHEMMSEK